MRKVQPAWTLAVLVCANDRPASAAKPSCGAAAGSDLRRWLRDRVRDQGLKDAVLVSTVHCLGVCSGAGTTVCAIGERSLGNARQTLVVEDSADRERVWSELKACLKGANT